MSAKPEKTPSPKPKPALAQTPVKLLKVEPPKVTPVEKPDDDYNSSAFVKLRNIKNESVSPNRLSGSFEKPEAVAPVVPDFIKKYMPQSVAKSQSMHAFNTQLVRELKARKEAGLEPLKMRSPVIDLCEGSGSDGESSGGREVRHITSRRRR